MPEMIDIADVATSAILVEQCGPSRNPTWHTRAGVSRRGVYNPFLAWETMPDVTIHRWHLRDVVLDGTTFLLFHHGRLIRQSNYNRQPDELAAACVRPADLVQVADDGPVLVCGDDWSTNHYHFLNHTLPAIHAASQPGLRLIGHGMRPAHAQMVQMLGHGGHTLTTVERGRQYAINDAVFCDFAVGRADFAISAFIQAMQSDMARLVPDAASTSARLYVSRTADTHRHMLGEAELIAGLQRRGFRIASPATMTLAEQIAAFRAASIVVGPHGAGMANIAFCYPGATIYDLLPAHFTDPSILTLAMRNSALAWVDAFPSETQSSDHRREWRVDVDAALRRVDDLLERTRWDRFTAAFGGR